MSSSAILYPFEPERSTVNISSAKELNSCSPSRNLHANPVLGGNITQI